MSDDFDRQYRVLSSRDTRFDGWFYAGVRTTGIYCRPSCPARTPKRENVRFYATPAAAQAAGHRACKRCRPDATPGSPEWNQRADIVGRAMRLIADGLVDREGVGGLARRLGYDERHVRRQLTAELGAGPLAIARAQRAQTARVLIENSALPLTQVAFAAGFASVRQFNDTLRAVFASSPTELRRGAPPGTLAGPSGLLSLRLPVRAPFHGVGLIEFLGTRAVPGVESLVDGTLHRSLRLPNGSAVVTLTPADGHVACSLRLDDLRDLPAAVERCRHLLDLDADPVAIDGALGADPILGTLVTASPGRRVPGSVDGAELAVRAVLGQQVSVAAARTQAARLAVRLGTALPEPDGDITHLFPTPHAIAESDPAALPMPRAKAAALVGLCKVLAAGDLVLDPGADRQETFARLVAQPGIGPWTASYIAMRALGDPDAFLPTDLGVVNAIARLGYPTDRQAVAALAERWRPWGAYAAHHLWASLDTAPTKET